MGTEEEVQNWLDQNPGSGMYKVGDILAFPDKIRYTRYAIVDRWGNTVGYVQKRVNQDE